MNLTLGRRNNIKNDAYSSTCRVQSKGDIMKNVEEALDIFQSEVTSTAWSFYVWKHFNNIAFSDRAIIEVLNQNPIAWNAILHSLQSTFFIKIGRLFDIDTDSFSFHSFIRFCIENINQFDLIHLKKRKMENGREPEWLNDYLNNVYIASEADMQKLRGEVAKCQKKYEGIYRPIRNQIYAHREISTISYEKLLFSKTRIEDLEGFLNLFFQIGMVIFDLMYNGKLHKIGDFTFHEEERTKKDVALLLDKIRGLTTASTL